MRRENETRTADIPPTARNSGIILLVVDRDQNQIDSICRGAFLHGHRCIAFTSEDKAVEFISNPTTPEVDVMVTDLTPEDRMGFRLIQLTRKLRPELPVIALIGLAVSEQIDEIQRAGVAILRRPFSSSTLDRALREVVV